MNACDNPLSGPDRHMSFNGWRIKINASSGQHDELQTAESPLKTVPAKGEKYATRKGSQKLYVTVFITILQ